MSLDFSISMTPFASRSSDALRNCPAMSADYQPLRALPPANQGVEWVDQSLHQLCRHSWSPQLDQLLELRRVLQNFGATGPESLLRDFTHLRKSAEAQQYLIFYRLRGWLQSQLKLIVSDQLDRIPPMELPLRLEFRCLDSLLGAARQEAFEHTNDPIRFEDLQARIEYR